MKYAVKKAARNAEIYGMAETQKYSTVYESYRYSTTLRRFYKFYFVAQA